MALLPPRARLVVIDALSVMKHLQTVIDGLYPKDDKAPDALYLPILSQYFLQKGANVRVFILADDYKKRSEFRNFNILERMYDMGLLYIDFDTTWDFLTRLVMCAKFNSAFIISGENFDNVPHYLKPSVEKYVRKMHVSENKAFKKEDLLTKLVVQRNVEVFINNAEYQVPMEHPDYYNACVSAVIFSMFDKDNFDFETLLDLIHFRVCYEILHQCPVITI